MSVVSAPVRELGVHRELDGLRGLAILAVLAMHVSFLDHGEYRFALSGGFLGVDVFLVLSGFLISGVLVREVGARGTVDGAAFARRRFNRLVPSLTLLVATQAVVALALGAAMGEQLLQIVLALTFTSNWQLSFGHQVPFELSHLWSLSLEGQFYALVGVGIWAIRGRFTNWRSVAVVVRWLLIGVVLVMVWRLVLLERGVNTMSLYTRTDTRLDSLLLGVATLLIWRYRVVSDRALRCAGLLGLPVLLVACWVAQPTSNWLYQGGFTVVSAAAAAVVAAAATGAGLVARLGDLAALRWVGRISYSLYLWHLPIYLWVRRAFPDASVWFLLLLALPASFVAATVTFHFIESRSIAHRRRPDSAAVQG